MGDENSARPAPAAARGARKRRDWFRWDFAIAVAPGRHVTIFTAGGLLVCAALIVTAAAIAAVMFVLG